MKNRILFLLMLCFAGFNGIFARQGLAINTSGHIPHASAIPDMSSTDKGTLIPPLTDGQMYLISNPAEGLIVYNPDCKCFYFFGPFGWEQITDQTNNHKLLDNDGDSYMTLRYDSNDDDTLRIFSTWKRDLRSLRMPLNP